MWQAAIILTASITFCRDKCAVPHHFIPDEQSLCSNAGEPCVSPEDKNNPSANFQELSFDTHIMYDGLTFFKKVNIG